MKVPEVTILYHDDLSDFYMVSYIVMCKPGIYRRTKTIFMDGSLYRKRDNAISGLLDEIKKSIEVFETIKRSAILTNF